MFSQLNNPPIQPSAAAPGIMRMSGSGTDCDRKELTRILKEKCGEAGFSAVGVAPASALTEEGKRLREWLEREYHAGMAWMKKNPEKRIDPSLLLPGCRSVIVTAFPYRKQNDPLVSDSRFGRISSYAQGKDYHVVIGEKLKIIERWLKERSAEIETKMCVDTGPVLEKAWAVKSGVGWQGKNTNVIRRRKGSYFFIGVIVTNIELDYDIPAADHCGTCSACIDACPTGALSPYVLDAGRCISYWTIEHKGEFNGELPSRFENWIFGCDICQEVCPWNKFSTEAETTDLLFFRPLAEWERMSEEEFRNEFRETPLKRPGFAGLMRNIKNAIGNSMR